MSYNQGMAYFVYILKCLDGSLYTGIATDVARRFDEHKNGTGAKYTRAHPPKKIVHTEKFRNRSRALKREAEIKRLQRKDKLKLISAR